MEKKFIMKIETKYIFIALNLLFAALTFFIATMIIPATIMTIGVISAFTLDLNAEKLLLSKRFKEIDDRLIKCERASISRMTQR